MKIERRSLLRAMSVGAALAPVMSLESAFASQCDRGSQDAGAAKVVQMDPNVSFAKQIERNVAPVVLLSTFLVKPEHVDDFLSGFQKRFAVMRKQPALISLRGAARPEFQAQLKQYPPGTEVSAFMFQRVAVPGMCLG